MKTKLKWKIYDGTIDTLPACGETVIVSQCSGWCLTFVGWLSPSAMYDHGTWASEMDYDGEPITECPQLGDMWAVLRIPERAEWHHREQHERERMEMIAEGFFRNQPN